MQDLFELSRVSDMDDVLAQIGQILPIVSVPDEVKYRATVDQEDADLISILIDDRDEVPALTIMEADGLAVAEALEKGSPHPETVRLILDRRCQQRNAQPPIPIELPDQPQVRNLVVQPHSLHSYDDLDDDAEGER